MGISFRVYNLWPWQENLKDGHFATGGKMPGISWVWGANGGTEVNQVKDQRRNGLIICRKLHEEYFFRNGGGYRKGGVKEKEVEGSLH